MAADEVRDPLRLARIDLAMGRAWAARDRLAGMLAHRPADQDVLGLLGEAWWKLGDSPRAGRYWFLTERDDQPARDAVRAFRITQPNAYQTAHALNVREGIEAYPAVVRTRLMDLERAVTDEGGRWSPGTVPRSLPEVQGRRPTTAWTVVRLTVAIVVLFALTAGVWVVGAIALLFGW